MTRKESLYRVTSKLPAALAAITLMLGVLAGGGTAAWALKPTKRSPSAWRASCAPRGR